MSKLWIGKRYGTRERLERAIARLERQVERWERVRDGEAWESEAYWAAHDKMMIYVERMRELMP